MVASWRGSEALVALLAEELGDPAVARAYAELVFSDVLQWRPPMVAPTEIKTIVAYSTQQAAYNAALKAGANIVQSSLLDFLR